jgi:hypothetical protein
LLEAIERSAAAVALLRVRGIREALEFAEDDAE